MAAVATLLIPGNTDAIIVQHIALADGPDAFPRDVLGPFPVPVGGLHHLFVPAIVARDARSGNLLWFGEFFLQFGKHRMVDRWFFLFAVLILQDGQRRAFCAVRAEYDQNQSNKDDKCEKSDKYSFHKNVPGCLGNDGERPAS